MPLGDKKRQLDEQVAAAVRRAVEELQQEVRSRLQEATESLQRSIGDITPRLPDSFVPEDQLRSMADEAAAAARAEALAVAHESAGSRGRQASFVELRAALSSFDRAGSQSEVLSALLEATRPHASRAAAFLVRGDRAHGWGGRGFAADDAVRSLSFDAGTAPWSELVADGSAGSGLKELSAQESAAIASALESALPDEAVVVALVLRDRVAAVLYADQVGGGELEIPALQILTYSAANALETQPLRSRRATATLAAGSLAAATAAISVEDYLPAVESEAAAVEVAEIEPEALPFVPEPAPEIVAAVEPEPPAPEIAESEPPAVLAEEPAAFDFRLEEESVAVVLEEPEPAVLEAAAPPLATAETEAWPLPVIEDFAPPPAIEADLPGAPSFDDVEIPAEPAASWADAGTGFDLEPIVSAPTMRYEIPVESAPEIPEAPEPAAEVALPPLEPLAAEPELPSLTGFADFAADSDGSLELVEEPPAPARPSLRWEEPEEDLPVVAAEPEPAPAPPAAVVMPPAGAETVLVPTLAPLPPPPAVAPAPPPPEPESEADSAAAGGAVGGGQVQAPPDLEGPGWAFSTTSVPIAKGDEPSHEEARRLARLLVSEIQLYNQEEVEEGRRNRDLYERLKDDIDRSRQLYEERVDPVIGKSTDYFYQELVRQLAAGDARALGI